MDHIVVVGGSLAGVHAAGALREGGFSGQVTLVGAEEHLPYDRPPLSKEALRGGPNFDSLVLHDAAWYENNGIDLRLGQRARDLNVANKTVTIGNGTVLDYDGLVIATGSQPRTLATATGTPIQMLRTFDDCAKLSSRLLDARSVAVIGGGFIGLEVAATARQMDCEVSVVELAPVPLSRVLGDEVGEWFKSYHALHGVALHCSCALASVTPVDAGTEVRLSNGKSLTADLVVAGIGAAPCTGWLEASGIKLSNGVVCDKTLRTSAPGIVAAGDVARWYNPLFDEEMRIEQWTNAVEQGRHAAASLLGGTDAYAAVPYFWSDQFDAKMRFVGRSNAADQIQIVHESDDSLVVVFGRSGVEVGALCINATRQLISHRKAISERSPLPVPAA